MHCAVSQVQIDEVLIRHSQLSAHLLEVVDCQDVETNSDLPLDVASRKDSCGILKNRILFSLAERDPSRLASGGGGWSSFICPLAGFANARWALIVLGIVLHSRRMLNIV